MKFILYLRTDVEQEKKGPLVLLPAILPLLEKNLSNHIIISCIFPRGHWSHE